VELGSSETSGMTETPSAPVVYLDTMSFIFAVEGEPLVAQPMRNLFEALRAHPGAGVTSELTLAEVLAGPEVPHSPPIRRAYLDLIVWSKFLDLVPIDRDILYNSADLRFAHREIHGKKLKLPDAIHLVTAIRSKCQYFASADKGINPPANMKRVAPDVSGVAEILGALA
jgi:predicted nucleic acid-binding protein